jgi:putative flippase GtrA
MENTTPTSGTVGASSTVKQFSKFVLVGVMNTLVDLAVLNAETLITGSKEGSGYAVQKGLSFLVAVSFSYFLNKNWTFQDKSQENQTKKFSQFLSVSVVGMLINVATATLVVTYLKPVINPTLNLSFLTDQLWVNIGALSGTAVGLIWNFIGYKLWVFKK